MKNYFINIIFSDIIQTIQKNARNQSNKSFESEVVQQR